MSVTFNIDKTKKIYLAGHTGLIGSTIFKRLVESNFKNILCNSHKDLDLTRQSEVEAFFKKEKPDYVILAAARVGGIYANSRYPASFIYENLMIQSNVIHAAYLYGVKKLLFFGSACSYPRDSLQPMKEEYTLQGPLEPTNEPYAIAKIAGITMCRSYNRQYQTQFMCAVPTNAYGPNDNFDPDDSHVIPALLRKFHKAKVEGENEVVIWGSGLPLREFIHADDVADAVLFLLGIDTSFDMVNIGSGEEISISNLVSIVKDVVGYKGNIIFDTTRPDGMFRKVLDVSIMTGLGWNKKMSLIDGIRDMYLWFVNHERDIERKWQIKN